MMTKLFLGPLRRASGQKSIIQNNNWARIESRINIVSCDSAKFLLPKVFINISLGTIHLRRQHVLGGGGVSQCADGPKVTVHKDQKSPS